MPKSRYIIRARNDEGALSAFLASIADDPAIEVADTIGPADRPHTAVLTVAPEQAAALEQRVRQVQQLTIEPDQPLSLDPQR